MLIIFSGAFPPCLINAYRGARSSKRATSRRRRRSARATGASSCEVLLPASVPSIVAGLRISAGLGWQSLIGAELIVASSGIGYLMVKGQSNISTSIVMAGMIAIGIVGFAIDVRSGASRRGFTGAAGAASAQRAIVSPSSSCCSAKIEV